MDDMTLNLVMKVMAGDEGGMRKNQNEVMIGPISWLLSIMLQ